MMKQRSYVAVMAFVGGICLMAFQNCATVNNLDAGADVDGGVNKMAHVNSSSVAVSVAGPLVVPAGASARFVANAIESEGNSIVYDWYVDGKRLEDRSNVVFIDIAKNTEISVVATSPVNAESASAAMHVSAQ